MFKTSWKLKIELKILYYFKLIAYFLDSFLYLRLTVAPIRPAAFRYVIPLNIQFKIFKIFSQIFFFRNLETFIFLLDTDKYAYKWLEPENWNFKILKFKILNLKLLRGRINSESSFFRDLNCLTQVIRAGFCYQNFFNFFFLELFFTGDIVVVNVYISPFSLPRFVSHVNNPRTYSLSLVGVTWRSRDLCVDWLWIINVKR